MPNVLSRLNTINLLESGALVEQIKQAPSEYEEVKRPLLELHINQTTPGLYEYKEEVFNAHERIHVPGNTTLKYLVLLEAYNCKMVGHGGQTRTYERSK